MTKGYTLEELYKLARQYGTVDVFNSESDGTFSCNITFRTVDHTELKAKSGFRHADPGSAILAAIEKAEEIAASFVAAAQRFGNAQRLGMRS